MDLHGIDVVVFLVFVATVVGIGLYKSRGGRTARAISWPAAG